MNVWYLSTFVPLHPKIFEYIANIHTISQVFLILTKLASNDKITKISIR